MNIRTIVKDSYYLLSDEYEMFGEKNFNYGFALPGNIDIKIDDEDEIPLSDLINKGKVNLEKIEIPEDIDSEQDDYEERVYLISDEVDSLDDITFLWFSVDGYESHDMVLYDIVKYKDKYLHLWLDED